LNSGEVYFSIYEIFFPSIGIGIGDFLTVTGGMSIITGSPEQILFVAPKLRVVKFEGFQLSTGMIYAGILDESFGIAYGVFTTGSSTASFTGGLGYGFVNGDFADNPFLMLGGDINLSKSSKLITENWFIPNDDNTIVMSFGLRFYGKHLAADFGLIKIPELDFGFPFFPWVGFAYKF